MNGQRGSAEEQSLAHLARRLVAADTGGWTPDGVRALAAELDWSWNGTPDSPVLVTGRPSGNARLRPVGRFEEPYVDGESYVELAVPVATVPADAAAQAATFRAAREELTAATSLATTMRNMPDATDTDDPADGPTAGSTDGPTAGLTVGQVSTRLGVTVRALHHWDEIGLARPSLRTAAGYRLYTAGDLGVHGSDDLVGVGIQTAVPYRSVHRGTGDRSHQYLMPSSCRQQPEAADADGDATVVPSAAARPAVATSHRNLM